MEIGLLVVDDKMQIRTGIEELAMKAKECCPKIQINSDGL